MADWHPLLAAREIEPGHWFMLDGLGEPYGEVRMVRRGGEVGYRADRCDARGEQPVRIGYFLTLRRATAEIHADFIRAHGAPASRVYGR